MTLEPRKLRCKSAIQPNSMPREVKVSAIEKFFGYGDKQTVKRLHQYVFGKEFEDSDHDDIVNPMSAGNEEPLIHDMNMTKHGSIHSATAT